jgi:vacuolar-type H+-ATPase subunit H
MENAGEKREPKDIMAYLTREVEKVVADAGEAAGREAEQEVERILGEYEQKTKHIMLKVREGMKARATEIANRLSEAICSASSRRR